MSPWIYIFLTVQLLLIQGYMNETIYTYTYCKEAVQSVETVLSCPSSKEEWDKAASRKNCWGKALKQNCTTPEKFVYHCVLNGYGNATLEVCAPKRLILGHCTEFNEVGGVIQDQLATPCSDVFPKCDSYYWSSEAFKYEDCYKLVEVKKLKTTTPAIVKQVLSDDETSDGDEINPGVISILTVGICLLGAVVIVIAYVYRKYYWGISDDERKPPEEFFSIRQTYDGKGDPTEVHEIEIPIVSIDSEEGSEGNAEGCGNDKSEVMPETQHLIGQDYDKNMFGVSEVKQRHSWQF